MKKILFVFLSTVLILTSCVEEKICCGKVVNKYLLAKNNGGVYNIVFYCDTLKRNISVSVTSNTYFNTEIGENICFSLSEYQIKY